jgi:hypothetical protein
MALAWKALKRSCSTRAPYGCHAPLAHALLVFYLRELAGRIEA